MLYALAVVAIAVEVLGLASATHALFRVRTPQGTVAWVVGLVAFPWLALPLYWFFGSRRFEAHSQAMQAKLYRHREQLDVICAGIEPFRVAREEVVPAEAAALSAIARQPFLDGNRLSLLIDGDATFGAILEAVAEARRCVYVQFYIMRPDGLGQRLLEALAAKAAAGVEVCFLIDSFGGASISPRIIRTYGERGVRIIPFSASSRWRDRWRLNFRNHRKNVIVDGRIGFVGGHNVGDEYLGLDPRYGRWRDTHVRVEGPSALQLQMAFVADWYFTTGELLDAPWEPDASMGSDRLARALVLTSGPSDHHERCTHFFMHAIAMARRRIWIASPYFVPDEGILQALQLAAIRGVEVRILLPMKPDQWLVWLASFTLLKELDHSQIHVHRYGAGFLHHKVLVVDDALAAVGTKNFDNRSFRLNFEITLAVTDLRFAAEVAGMFEQDLRDSTEVGPRAYDQLPFPLKVGAKAARLLAPIL
jgi:cardiolipin synthase